MDLKLELKLPNQTNPTQYQNLMNDLVVQNVRLAVLLLIAEPLIATVPSMQRRKKKEKKNCSSKSKNTKGKNGKMKLTINWMIQLNQI